VLSSKTKARPFSRATASEQLQDYAHFFRQCLLLTRPKWPLGNKYFDHILPLYNSAAPSSALPLAVSVIALKVATIRHAQDYVQPLVTRAKLAAVRAINLALSDLL
jgi:hypothetical protein